MNVRGAALKLKQMMKERFLFTKNPKPVFQNCSDSEKAHSFIATWIGRAPFLPVSDPAIVDANTTSSCFEL
jgi:hypothetical protein